MSLKKQLLAAAIALGSSFTLTACEIVVDDPSSSSGVALSNGNLSSEGGSSANVSVETVSSAQLSSETLSSQALSSAEGTSSSYSSATSSSSTSRFGIMIDDRDNQTYLTIEIGNQVWMAENLNYGKLDDQSYAVQKPGQKYCYQNSVEECAKGGGLYQWHRAMDLPDTCASESCANLIANKHQGICPTGWHMPNPSEWIALIQTLGGYEVAGEKIKLNNTPWSSWNTIYNDGNSSGFSAYPNGIRYYEGDFKYHGSESNGGPVWWTTTEWNGDARNAHRFYVNWQTSNFSSNYNHEKLDAFSVRCIKD